MASDLISRSALLAEYDRVHVGEPGGARKLMEEAPAVDAVPVVRCKDCVNSYLEEKWVAYRCRKHGNKVVGGTEFCNCGMTEEQYNAIDMDGVGR